MRIDEIAPGVGAHGGDGDGRDGGDRSLPHSSMEQGALQDGYLLGHVWITPGCWLADSRAWAVSLDAMLRAYLGGADVVLLVNPQNLTVYASPVRRILQQGRFSEDGHEVSLRCSAWMNRVFDLRWVEVVNG
jgi:hypothetical protein